MYDTSGQERFHAISKSFYRKVKVCLLVYDVTNRQSFEKLDFWLNDVKESCDENVIFVCVGNKIDLERVVAKEEGLKFARDNNFSYTETSALTLEGVEDLFKETLSKVLEEGLADDGIKKADNVTLDSGDNNEANGYSCC